MHMWLHVWLGLIHAKIGLELKIRYQTVGVSYRADMMQHLCRLQPVNTFLLFHTRCLSGEITPVCCAGISVFTSENLAHQAAAHLPEVAINKLFSCPMIIFNVVMNTYFLGGGLEHESGKLQMWRLNPTINGKSQTCIIKSLLK